MTPIYFYETDAGNEPVREWLKDLNRIDRKVIGDDLQTVQMGWSLGVIKEPLVKSFGSGLFELRSSLPSRRISRVFFVCMKMKSYCYMRLLRKLKKHLQKN